MQRKKDELDRLNEEIDFRRDIGSNAYPEISDKRYIARRYEKVAEKLTDKVRKDEALRSAASHYCQTSYRPILSDWEKALELYEKTDNPGEKAKKLKDSIKGEYRGNAYKTLKSIADKNNYRSLSPDFKGMIYLSKDLEKAGFPEKAKKYKELIEHLINLAKTDLIKLRAKSCFK